MAAKRTILNVLCALALFVYMICSTLPRSDTMMVRLSVRELLIWAVFVLVSTTAVQAPNPVALTSAAIDEFLAREYGHLPVDQRRNVGLVPMNLDVSSNSTCTHHVPLMVCH